MAVICSCTAVAKLAARTLTLFGCKSSASLFSADSVDACKLSVDCANCVGDRSHHAARIGLGVNLNYCARPTVARLLKSIRLYKNLCANRQHLISQKQWSISPTLHS